ncbi:hypothetical protein Tco_0544040 [Tanacetum coccineum]
MLDSNFIPSDDSLGSDLEVSFPSGTRNKIFDPGIFFEVQSKRFLSQDTFSISFIRTDVKEMDKRKIKNGQNRARDRKEHEDTSSTVPSDFIGPARNPFYGPGQPNILLAQQKPKVINLNILKKGSDDIIIASPSCAKKINPKNSRDIALCIGRAS